MKEGARKIKVCQVVSVDISLKYLLLGQIRFLQEKGFEVWGVSSKGEWVEELRRNFPIKNVLITRKLFTPLSDFLAVVHLIWFFRKEKFDIVHTHTPKAALLGQIAAILAGVPIRINTVHGLYFQKDSSFLKKFIFSTIEKIISWPAHLIFTVNREDIETMVDMKIADRGKIQYLGDGIDMTRFSPSHFSEEDIMGMRQELGIDPRKKVIGIVARLVREKGYLDLFRAFRMVLDKMPDTELIVVGPEEPEKEDGINPEIVKEYGIEKNVKFVGEREDVEKFYALMDVFVLPSYREGLGLSILEASAMERPVIATNVRGCREAVENGRTGTLVPPKNSEKLAEALIWMFSHPEEAKKMGKEGRAKVEREFSEKVVFTRIEKEYRRLIQERLTYKRNVESRFSKDLKR